MIKETGSSLFLDSIKSEEGAERNPKTKSLQRFLIIVIFLSIVAPAIITGSFLIYENVHRTIDQDSKVTANNYADLLQAGMQIPLWNIEPSLGRPIVDTIRIEPSVLKILIKDADGRVFLEYLKKGSVLNKQSFTLHRDVSFNKEKIGSVQLVYSFKAARIRALNESKLLFTIIIFQLVCSLALTSYFLKLRVFSPLTQLEKAAAGISGGDLKTTIPSQKNDEFGALSHQLEIMRGSLDFSFATLEERVRERTTELVEVNEELTGTLDKLRQAQGDLVQQEKLAALGALVAGVAHELNTPIGNGLTVASSIAESTQGIQSKMNEGMTRAALEDYLAEMQEGANLVVSSLERAAELLSSFKQVAVDRTSDQRRKFNLLEMLDETKLTLSPMFKHTAYKVRLDVEPDIELMSYPGPLGQIITNFFNNSIIHGFEGRGDGEIKVIAKKGEGNTVNLSVVDDGRGIPEENLSRIFDPFFTTKLGEGGNGLGMHIVHNIVSGVLGGSIEVESKVGQGTCFHICLPLEAPDHSDDEFNVFDGMEVNE